MESSAGGEWSRWCFFFGGGVLVFVCFFCFFFEGFGFFWWVLEGLVRSGEIKVVFVWLVGVCFSKYVFCLLHVLFMYLSKSRGILMIWK